MTHVRLVLILMLVLAMSAGCSTPSAEVTVTPDDEALEATCFANQQTVELQVRTKMTQTDDAVPSSFAKLADEGWIPTAVTCPGGGTYEWDAGATRLSCSIHGHYQ